MFSHDFQDYERLEYGRNVPERKVRTKKKFMKRRKSRQIQIKHS